MRQLQGTIVSAKMHKTVVVRVDRLVRHPKYRKYYRVSRRFKAHVESGSQYQLGDVVRISETRPFSKDKRWKVTEVIRRAPEAVAEVSEEPSGEETPSS